MKLRQKQDSQGRTLFTFECPICGARGSKVAPGRQWLPHRYVFDLLEPHGSPFDLVRKIPSL